MPQTHMSLLTHTPPIILIPTPGCSDALPFYRLGSYITAVQQAGGLPVLLAPADPDHTLENFLALCSGVLLIGGGDIHPQRFGAECHSTTYGVDEARDEAEIAIAKFAMTSNIPILGICRGCQVLAVAAGGDLYTHLGDHFDGIHRFEASGQAYTTRHLIQLKPESRLSQITRSQAFYSASWHHCAVKTIPSDWDAVGYANDGAIEAIEHQNHPFAFGIQWHPEIGNQNEERQIFAAL
jgi:putative glutamine amidotransferase